MENNQADLLKINKTFFTMGNIIITLIVLDYIKEYLMNKNSLGYTLTILGSMSVMAVIVFTTYFRNRSSSQLKWIGTTCMYIVFAIALWCASSIEVYILGFAFQLVCLLYLDIKLMRFTSIMVGAINIIDCLIRVLLSNEISADPFRTYSLVFPAVLIFGYGFEKAIKLINELRREKDERIQLEIDRQNKLLGELFVSIEVLENNTSKVNNVVDEFSSSSEIVSRVVKQISKGTENVTVSIQEQTEMTKRIRHLIEETAIDFQNVKHISEDSQVYLKQGNEMMATVTEKSIRADEQNKYTYEIMKQLKERSQKVHGITEDIAEISKQTNLLSLNAAIESARAGEAGKGFSVVAEEIRNLSNQTEELTSSICEIINELEKNVQEAEVAVRESNELNNEQNNLVNATKDIFDKMIVKMQESHDRIEQANQKVDQVVKSNETIMESISEISAASQETLASVEEANGIADNNLESAKLAEAYVKELVSVSERLKEHT